MKPFILEILIDNFGEDLAESVYEESPLIRYLDSKMGAVYGNSKTRRSLANIYAIYSLTYFYSLDFFEDKSSYRKFDGYEYMKLFVFYRGLYGGEKLQNHALNSRVNGEFLNKVRDADVEPIVINNGKYALNINYLYVGDIDISKVVNAIVEKYIALLKAKDNQLLADLDELSSVEDTQKKRQLISGLLTDSTEARIFEIVSFAILKAHYGDESVFIGFSPEDIKEVQLKLYKTGRTNANDGGIDFVMRPLGRFFQVTEVDNYEKYLLDIDKVLHFPISFVIKTEKTKEQIQLELEQFIQSKSGGMEIIINRYHNAIEEIITINELRLWLSNLSEAQLNDLIKDIEVYYSLEMNLLENSVIYPDERTPSFTYALEKHEFE